MSGDAEIVLMGRVSGVFGLKGWVKVQSYARPQAELLQYRHWRLQKNAKWVSEQLLESRVQGRGLVAHFAGYDDIEAAQSLVGLDIGVPRTELPVLPPGSLYWADMEGLQVHDVSGVCYGSISHLIETGANDVMVVRSPKGKEILIPYIGSVVQDVDQAGRVLYVAWDPDDAD